MMTRAKHYFDILTKTDDFQTEVEKMIRDEGSSAEFVLLRPFVAQTNFADGSVLLIDESGDNARLKYGVSTPVRVH
jgi:hypothetical protein